ncbi:MAG: ZIP family metal transporter [Acholeplasmataceae bacterium]|jgi:ZIP family zinc transporter|nr:ZIP family metal transporter [Acholeplasmataceae bacterium]
MIDWLLQQPVWLIALLAGLLTWGITALGAGLVFFFKKINNKAYALMLGFASGVMIAASVWSLIIPALEHAEDLGYIPWLVAAIGILLGVIFLYIFDRCLPHLHFGEGHKPEGPKTSWSRIRLLIFSITLHNIPEGLAVGVAIGAVGAFLRDGAVADARAALISAIIVSIGIGIQNFPEGAAVSIPLRQEGLSRSKSFFYGQASALVEPLFAVIGAILVQFMLPILPYALAFAAGAMIFVVVEELIPEARNRSTETGAHYSTFGFTIGFIVMMVLDIALG